VTIRLEDGSVMALAQVKSFDRVEHGRREHVRSYVTRRPKEGWIPEEKWLEGQRIWEERGEAEWDKGVPDNLRRALPPRDQFVPRSRSRSEDMLEGAKYLRSLKHPDEHAIQLRDGRWVFFSKVGIPRWVDQSAIDVSYDDNQDTLVPDDHPDQTRSLILGWLPSQAESEPEPPAHPQHLSPSQGMAELQREVADGLRKHSTSDPAQPDQGVQGHVEVLDLDDGHKVVDKSGMEQPTVDREVLAYHISQAVGAGAPAVAQVQAAHGLFGDNGEIAEEFAPGEIFLNWIDKQPDPDAAKQRVYNSDAGKRIGLMDYLTQNIDRHGGNYIMQADGTPVPIDHGLIFAGGQVYSPFWRATTGQWWNQHPELMDEIRSRLEATAPEFAARGREQWLTTAIERLDFLREQAEPADQAARPLDLPSWAVK
jgi:hypothetical protein